MPGAPAGRPRRWPCIGVCMPLHRALFCETNPAPAKYALSRLGRSAEDVRLPLVALSERAKAEVDAALVAVGLAN